MSNNSEYSECFENLVKSEIRLRHEQVSLENAKYLAKSCDNDLIQTKKELMDAQRTQLLGRVQEHACKTTNDKLNQENILLKDEIQKLKKNVMRNIKRVGKDDAKLLVDDLIEYNKNMNKSIIRSRNGSVSRSISRSNIGGKNKSRRNGGGKGKKRRTRR